MCNIVGSKKNSCGFKCNFEVFQTTKFKFVFKKNRIASQKSVETFKARSALHNAVADRSKFVLRVVYFKQF